MLCVWCGEETPNDSVFCENCGHALEGVEAASDSEDAEAVHDFENADTIGEDVNKLDAAPPETEELSDEVVSETSESCSPEPLIEYVETEVDAISRTNSDVPLVNPPSPPIQPKLSRGLVAVVATIAVLFAAAVILLAGVSIMRFLGL